MDMSDATKGLFFLGIAVTAMFAVFALWTWWTSPRRVETSTSNWPQDLQLGHKWLVPVALTSLVGVVVSLSLTAMALGQSRTLTARLAEIESAQNAARVIASWTSGKVSFVGPNSMYVFYSGHGLLPARVPGPSGEFEDVTGIWEIGAPGIAVAPSAEAVLTAFDSPDLKPHAR